MTSSNSRRSRLPLPAALINITLLLTASAWLAGCAPLPRYRLNPLLKTTEVGDVRAQIVSIAPWNDIIAEMQPAFKLDSAGALEKVLPITQRSINNDRFGGSIAGSSSIAGGIGTAAPEQEALDTTPPETTLGDSPFPQGSLGGVDPFLQYSAATALFQEVALLNQYVQNAAQAKDAVPYLVRLQVAHLPYDDRLGADAYIDFTFCARRDARVKHQLCNELLVVPLLAIESFEQSIVERTVEVALAAAFAKQVSVAASLGKAASAQASRMRRIRAEYERVRARLGRDVDALMITGSRSSNVVTTKLAGSNGGTTRRRMVTRTHYVSVLVMVPRSVLREGTSRDSREPPQLSVSYAYQYRWDRRGGTIGNPQVGATSEAALPNLHDFHMSQCDLGYVAFGGHLIGHAPTRTRLGGYKFPNACKARQPVAILDDGKTSEVVFGAVQNARAANLSSVVYVENPCKKAGEFVPVRSTRVAFDKDAKIVRASFPSLTSLMQDTSGKECPLASHRVALFAANPRYYNRPSGDQINPTSKVIVEEVYYRRIADGPAPTFPNIALHGASTLTADNLGRATSTLVIDERVKGQFFSVHATAVGADLGVAELLEVDALGKPLRPERVASVAASTGKGLHLDKKGTWHLRFTNAVPGQTITVKLVAPGSGTTPAGVETFTYFVRSESLPAKRRVTVEP